MHRIVDILWQMCCAVQNYRLNVNKKKKDRQNNTKDVIYRECDKKKNLLICNGLSFLSNSLCVMFNKNHKQSQIMWGPVNSKCDDYMYLIRH